MTDRINCSIQSHPACFEPEAEAAESPPATPKAPTTETNSQSSHYECVDECLSSLGVAHLVSGMAVGLGCIISRPACPILMGGSAGAVLGWCEAKCDEPGDATR